MGNCQAAEAATVVIQHPGNKVERIYWSATARQVMTSNPGHFVALVLTSPIPINSGNATPAKQLKLLRPDDTLLIGQVYRLISVQDVLKEFAAKKCVKLGKLLKERGMLDLDKKIDVASTASNHLPNGCPSSVKNEEEQRVKKRGGSGSGSGSSRREKERVVGRHQHQQWKPALQSIAEIGT